jgi:formamidopyrimidine-DNA glycosylase
LRSGAAPVCAKLLARYGILSDARRVGKKNYSNPLLKTLVQVRVACEMSKGAPVNTFIVIKRNNQMPELPEVHTICRGLSEALTGKTIVSLEQRREGARLRFPSRFSTRVEGKKIVSVRRRAKFIIMELDGDDAILFHLGMSGRLVLCAKGGAQEKHDHLIFSFNDGLVLKFHDPRRFGICDLVPKKSLDACPHLKKLGVEPLSQDLSPEWLEEKLRGRKTSIKSALMDQSIIAGLGNIYVCEALYHAGISPLRQAGKCSEKELKKLVKEIKSVLERAIKAGGSTLRDYVRADGKKGLFQLTFAVYGREGEKCPACHSACRIGRVVQSGRSSFYCPNRQK